VNSEEETKSSASVETFDNVITLPAKRAAAKRAPRRRKSA
jgi:hypothetical protein